MTKPTEDKQDEILGMADWGLDGQLGVDEAMKLKDQAKQAIQDWALDIVGEDEDWKDNDYAKFSIAIDGGEAMRALYEHRNKLRAELRKQIRGSDEAK